MSSLGFMIPLNEYDYDNKGYTIPNRDICSPANATYLHNADWWTNENIRLTIGGVPTPLPPMVGQQYVIQVGVQGLKAQDGDTPSVIQNVQAWVCYPNTVAGGAAASLVVPSMQSPNTFASFTNTTGTAPLVFGDAAYQDTGHGFQWISLSSWTPTEEDFILEQSEHEGHCCIIANAAGLADATSDANSGMWTGEQVGVVLTTNQLDNNIHICSSLYQGQRNTMIVNAPGGMLRSGLAFLSGTPTQARSTRTTVTVAAIDQGDQIDPVLLKALSGGQYAGLTLKPATTPPKSLRLVQHGHQWHGWLVQIVHEAEEILEELIGLAEHPFGGGHRLHLRLPLHGLQPLRMEMEFDPSEPPGTVHAIEITQTDADGARGGLRVGVVVLP